MFQFFFLKSRYVICIINDTVLWGTTLLLFFCLFVCLFFCLDTMELRTFGVMKTGIVG